MNPLDVLSIVRQVRKVYRKVKPDLVHHVALQPTIVGSLAAFGLPIMRLNALAGLGYSFTSSTAKARLVRRVLSVLFRLLLRGPRAAVLVQNSDDAKLVRALSVDDSSVFLIPGSGVDTKNLIPLPEPEEPVTAAFVGRLLDDKGLRSLVAAQDLLRQRGENIHLVIAGDRDELNPSSISDSEIKLWKLHPGVTLPGHVSDIRSVWAGAHIAVLPSRREGLPKSLLEAAACGRPIVATDVPGCREIARADVNAILVPPDNPEALAAAIARLAQDPSLRVAYGKASRRLVEEEFSSARIGALTVALYDRLTHRRTSLDARLLQPPVSSR
jgi:glycosyltransferase involved in cell wall biosynthesis